uniref:Putative conserved secreted protein n=1 Tax=Amblyomma tuberculatum TaxID=48802 RepID=A0A6M2E5C9_9ACAR
MLFGTLFVMFLGVFAAEGKNILLSDEYEKEATTLRYAMRVVQSKSNLHLLAYSNELKKVMTKCLRSQYLATIKDGANRTLDTNSKFNKTSNIIYTHSKSNVSITLSPDLPFHHIRVVDNTGKLPSEWGDFHDVLYADLSCIVLRATPSKPALGDMDKPSEKTVKPSKQGKVPCVVWGVQLPIRVSCINIFSKLCSKGTQVNMRKCGNRRRN